MTQAAKHLQTIGSAGAPGYGFDIVIVSTHSKQQAHYWRKRLNLSRGHILTKAAELHVVVEKWPGGAGNGLGTLYALQLASSQDPDLFRKLADGASLALYHTAGKGTRIAPLGGSEGNNKSSVKLPSTLPLGNSTGLMTLLEGVIKQTSLFAPLRSGRLSVFWGDQLFLPSSDLTPHPAADIHILGRHVECPNQASWERQGLSSYGLILKDSAGRCCQVEKSSFGAIQQMHAKQLFVSLGAFDISAKLLADLLDTFSTELTERQGRLDTDPHFWMPLTLTRNDYLRLRGEEWADHYERMQALRATLGVIDIGADAYWWDFGQVRHYISNLLKLTEVSPEADALRDFFGVTRHPETGNCIVDGSAPNGTVRDCVLMDSHIDRAQLSQSVVVSTRAPELSGQHSLIYNVSDENPLQVPEKGICADVAFPEQRIRLFTTQLRDGGQDWETRLPGNPLSYSEVYARHQNN